MNQGKESLESRLDTFKELNEANSADDGRRVELSYDSEKESALNMLRQQIIEGAVERYQLMVLEKMVESDFTIDHVGTMVDELGCEIGYIFLKSAYLAEPGGQLLTGIFVTRISGDSRAFLHYARQQLEGGGVLSEEEKKVCLRNIEAACILREEERVGQRPEH